MGNLYTGTIISDTPNAAFSTLFKSWINDSGLANWSFIENIPAGKGDYQSGNANFSVDVFKCSGSGDDANDAGIDWYFLITNETIIQPSNKLCSFAEFYNDTDKTVKGWPITSAGSTNQDCAIDENGYLYYSSYDTSTYQKALYNYLAWSCPTLNTSGFNYWVYLDNDFVVISFKVGTMFYSYYYGLMDSLVSAAGFTDEYPLVLLSNGYCGVDSVVGSFGTFIRYPTVGAQSSANYVGRVSPKGWQYPANIITVENTDLWLNNKIFTSRLLVIHDTINNFTSYGCFRGLLKEEIRCIYSSSTDTCIGDTINIDGVTWTIIGKTYMFDLICEGS